MKTIPGLQDIQGLDAISFWPLAIGWWVVFGLIAVVTTVAVVFHFRRQARLLNWRNQLLRRLEFLEKNLNPENAKATAVEVSTLLRRLAIRRYSRIECASLEGKKWLNWLSEKDSAKFNWSLASLCLIEAPFSPDGAVIDSQALRTTIHAAKEWVK